MIRQIRGTIADKTDDAVIIDVGGIGYYVRITESPTRFTPDQTITFYTHLAVRETALDLYGFTDLDTLEIFEVLITLPKIGPKSAQQILRQADTALLRDAVRNDDASYLAKLSGIGKKSAEKIVLGLKEKLNLDTDDESFEQTTSAANTPYTRDTVDALLALGYSQAEARDTVQTIAREHPEITDSAAALKRALQILSN